MVDTPECDGGFSGKVGVDIRAKIFFDTPKNCDSDPTVTGEVKVNHKGTYIYLRRNRKLVARDKLNKNSRFRFDLHACRGHYRAAWPQQDGSNIDTDKELFF